MPKFPKGSQEAKDYMASIRAKRGTKPKCPCGKSKKKCSCMSGGAIDMPPQPPVHNPPPTLPPTIQRVTGFNLDRNLILDPRIRRIIEITEHLMAGRDASMPVGQRYSQQQVETLIAERAALEMEGQGIVSDVVESVKTGAKVNEIVEGAGMKKKPKLVKGSKEAKEFMASIRAKRGKGIGPSKRKPYTPLEGEEEYEGTFAEIPENFMMNSRPIPVAIATSTIPIATPDYIGTAPEAEVEVSNFLSPEEQRADNKIQSEVEKLTDLIGFIEEEDMKFKIMPTLTSMFERNITKEQVNEIDKFAKYLYSKNPSYEKDFLGEYPLKTEIFNSVDKLNRLLENYYKFGLITPHMMVLRTFLNYLNKKKNNIQEESLDDSAGYTSMPSSRQPPPSQGKKFSDYSGSEKESLKKSGKGIKKQKN